MPKAKKQSSHSPYKRYRIFKIVRNTIILIVALVILSCCLIRTVSYFWNNSSMVQKQCKIGDNVALIKVHGDIVTYKSSTDEDVASSDKIVNYIQEADRSNRIKAIILDIDSFGGSPVAGEEIANALKTAKKPTFALIRDVGDSAAYMIATGAQKIYASNFSEIGNIGVTMSYLDFSEKNAAEGVIYQQLSSGEFKDIANPNKPMTDEERDILINYINQLESAFVSMISTNRNIARSKVEEIANGSIMTAGEAKTRGLIDEIGGLGDIKTYISAKIKKEPKICSME